MAVTIDGTKGVTSSGSFYGQTTFTGTYTDGVVVDYTTGMGRISVGTSDGLTIYNGGVASSALVTVTSSGNVGIGTSSPTRLLEIGSGSQNALAALVSDSGVTRLDFGNAANKDLGRINYAVSDNSMQFFTNKTERARINSSGNLLVGNTNGTSKITATGVVESTTGGFKFPDGTTQTSAGTASLAANGYQKLPSGVIIQWVTGSAIPNATNGTVTFPITFPNSTFAVYVSVKEATYDAWAEVRSFSTSSASIGVRNYQVNAAIVPVVLAIGY